VAERSHADLVLADVLQLGFLTFTSAGGILRLSGAIFSSHLFGLPGQ
jgi:hypothetical protein